MEAMKHGSKTVIKVGISESTKMLVVILAHDLNHKKELVILYTWSVLKDEEQIMVPEGLPASSVRVVREYGTFDCGSLLRWQFSML